MTSIAQPVDLSVEAAQAAFLHEQERIRWRRRLLPLVGIATTLLVWAALVYVLKVPPFVAPSPQLVAFTLYNKFGLLLANLWPTAALHKNRPRTAPALPPRRSNSARLAR